MNKLYPTSEILKMKFQYLTDNYGFKIINEIDSNIGVVLEYSKVGINVKLGFDFRDYFFSFRILRLKDKEVLDEYDRDNEVV